ncbi:MAG: peptide protein [Segetibacter sp.]|nr:peptide protein [Segetibacter sp.]
MKNIALFVGLIFFVSVGFRGNSADEILGVWANETNKGHLQLYKQNGKYYGKIVWLNQPNDETGKPKVDKNNPDDKVRKERLLGLVMLKDFRYENGEWTDGKIYNPDDGKEYQCNMKLKDSKTLSVRGYIGISLFGKTQKFTRIR